jgi:hypothetical protein
MSCWQPGYDRRAEPYPTLWRLQIPPRVVSGRRQQSMLITTRQRIRSPRSHHRRDDPNDPYRGRDHHFTNPQPVASEYRMVIQSVWISLSHTKIWLMSPTWHGSTAILSHEKNTEVINGVFLDIFCSTPMKRRLNDKFSAFASEEAYVRADP